MYICKKKIIKKKQGVTLEITFVAGSNIYIIIISLNISDELEEADSKQSAGCPTRGKVSTASRTDAPEYFMIMRNALSLPIDGSNVPPPSQLH